MWGGIVEQLSISVCRAAQALRDLYVLYGFMCFYYIYSVYARLGHYVKLLLVYVQPDNDSSFSRRRGLPGLVWPVGRDAHHICLIGSVSSRNIERTHIYERQRYLFSKSLYWICFAWLIKRDFIIVTLPLIKCMSWWC